jgi:hypothetical protein
VWGGGGGGGGWVGWGGGGVVVGWAGYGVGGLGGVEEDGELFRFGLRDFVLLATYL